ncbi:kinase-like protein [Ramicandelaber brevisporus]|nr:kinase-like protein [Ramicandelaber brevisporus]
MSLPEEQLPLALAGASLLRQGAEARVYTLDSFYGRPCVAKHRFTKTYRHPQLDRKLTAKRVAHEARALQKSLLVGLDAPALYHVDVDNGILCMEFIDGTTVRDYIYRYTTSDGFDEQALEIVASSVGAILAKMHDNGIIHGDLTTSNMIVRSGQFDSMRIALIDFGLSSISALVEDKAVDLYVLERAFLSSHPGSEHVFENILAAYRTASSKKLCGEVMTRLEDVRMRGRKRSMVG